ncbi:MAG: protein SCO1/2 [Sulfurimonas sp.]|jgi:protein SCO1/2|uniref:SCO family protein n=1 Tax=Sulfurimonas sp. TaxID=2022749 RepID=UPI0039E4AECA
MKKKIYSSLILLIIISISILVMILPSFLTKGVSRVSLHKELQLPLLLDDEKEIKLVFFGYVGCVDICTPRLQALNEFYNSLSEDAKQTVGITFIDISIPSDTTLPNSFAKFFNKDFKGIYLDNNTMRAYTKAFQVYFSKSLLNKKEFDHSTNLYLIKKENNKKYLRFVYSAYPFDFKQIHSDIEELESE